MKKCGYAKLCSESCKRYGKRIVSPCLRGIGNTSADIMLVGEAPGQREDEYSEPFIGPSGKLLNGLLEEAGISRDDVFITNAVKCATPKENIAPTKAEIKACRGYLKKEIDIVKPTVVGALGAKAMDALLNRTGITTLKNTPLMSEEFGVKVVPIYHPAYALRNPAAIDDIREGLRVLIQESKGEKIVSLNTKKTKYVIATTPDKIDAVLAALEKQSVFSFDFEASALDPLKADILSISFCWKERTGASISWPALSKAQKARMYKILADPNKRKIAHNVKYELEMCMTHGIPVQKPWDCTMLMHHLLDENNRHGLDGLTLVYTDMGEYWKPLDDWKKEFMRETKIKKDEFSYSAFPVDLLCEYNAKDADSTLRVFNTLRPRLDREQLSELYYNYVLPYTDIVVEMELRGVKCDRDSLKLLLDEYTVKERIMEEGVFALPKVKAYEARRCQAAVEKIRQKYEASKILPSRYPEFDDYVEKSLKDSDYKFNMRSTLQLREILFTIPRRKPIKFTDKKSISVDEEVLNTLAAEGEEIAATIVQYRKISKYLSTYIRSTYEKSEFDGRIHADYLQHLTTTGRLSSRNPNMQNIPRDAKDFKRCFIADPGNIFVKADLAQAEFRCWAHYSSDEDMIADIEGGLDIHRRTASEVFGITEDAVTEDQRTAAKNCVAGDTWIPTSGGFKQICDLKEGDVVLDHFNREQTILETISKEDDLYLVETECGSVKCTKDHPFYVINSNAELIFKPLEELFPGDYLLSCTPKNQKTEYLTWEYTGDRNTSFKPIKNQWVLDPSMGYLLGFILAEGSISEKSGHTHVRWSQKGKFVDIVTALSTKLFGNRVKQYVNKLTQVINWNVASLEFVAFLKYTGMCTDNKKGFKSFPHKIMESPLDVQKAVLQGYFLGDGTLKNHIACVGTVSKELCDGVCLLLRNFGIYPKVHVEHPKGGEDFYNIHITTNEELDILTKKIEVEVPENWTPPVQCNGRKILHNVKAYYQNNHPVGDTRYHIKLRKNLTTLFMKNNCMGIREDIDELLNNNIYSVKITDIKKVGKGKVYDFVTTGDKVMVANSLISLDCVFGLMYGRGSAAVAAQYDISVETADEIKQLFFARYPKASQWLERQKVKVAATGYVRSALGRLRRLPEIDSENPGVAAEAQRQAMNSPIQAQASDMNNHYMVTTILRAREEGIECWPVSPVHDANFIEVREDQKDRLVEIMKDVTATEFPDFKCEMKLDFEVGKNFGDLEGVAA